MRRHILFVLLPLFVAGACAPSARLPDLRAIYNQASANGEKNGDRRPLITIPGTLGSRLVDRQTGKVIWGGGGSSGISADPKDPEEYQLIALPIVRGSEPLSSLRDTVVSEGILETAEAEVLGIPIDIDVYGEALGVLSEGGFRIDRRPSGGEARDYGIDERIIARPRATAPVAKADSDFDSFQFDYDWRRDLIESAHRFGRFLERRRSQIARTRGMAPEEVKFDLLAHSMGTLVSRYFLMYGFADPPDSGDLPPITWEGAKYFSRVVFVAPPNAGSVIALDNLVNGKELGPLQPTYSGTLLASHPAAYQLMPRARHRRVLRDNTPVSDLYDVEFWDEMEWGLLAPGVDQQLQLMMPDEVTAEGRKRRARLHTQRSLRRAERFHQMLDRWTDPPTWLDLFLVVGGGFETPATAEINAETREFRITENEEGDGVVLRASALLDERQDGDLTTGFRSPLRFKTTLFLPDEHVELTKNRVFADNLLFWLVAAPRTREELNQPVHSGLLASVADGSTSPDFAQQEAARGLPVPDNDR